MTIGLDLSVLQGPHRMRGVGYTLINFINHLPPETKKNDDFVFYMYNTTEYGDPLELLELDEVQFESRVIRPLKIYKASDRLPRIFKFGFSLFNQLRVLRDIYFGDRRIKNLQSVDHYIQFDQSQPLPARYRVKTTLIMYDLIPYVMEADYFWSFRTARIRGVSVKGALRHEYRRRRWIAKQRRIVNGASEVIAISEHTKKDCIRYLGINSSKVHVCLLGVSSDSKQQDFPKFKEYVSTGWGPVQKDADLRGLKYILFVGGADHRRHLTELVAAFNNLRARNIAIKLVLAGDTMLGPFEIPNLTLQAYFRNTSYIKDIIFLGFVDDAQRDWLYRNAVAFIYPSVYEGFGLPILEAMQHGTPVISYSNSSIGEVAGGATIIANNFMSIYDSVMHLIDNPNLKKKYALLGKKQASKFNWDKSSREIIKTFREY